MSPRRKPPATPMPSESRLEQWPVDKLVPDSDNPRVDLGDIAGLAQSINENGLLQPIVVRTGERTDEHGEVVIQAGHRRHAAVISLGWTHVDVIVRVDTPTDRQRLAAMLVENVQRHDLSPIEEARAYQTLVDSAMTQRQIATATGCSQPTISKRLGLLKLPEQAQQWVVDGTLAVDLATVLASLPLDRVTQLCAAGPPTEARVVDERRRLNRAKKIAQETDRLAAAGITVLAAGDPRLTAARRVGPEWRRVDVDVDAHQSEPCAAARVMVEYDGTIQVHWLCLDHDRHEPGGDSTLTIVEPDPAQPCDDASQLAAGSRQIDIERRQEQAAARTRTQEAANTLRRRRWTWLADNVPLPDDWTADAVSWLLRPAQHRYVDDDYGRITHLVELLGLDPDHDMPDPYDHAIAEGARRLETWAASHGHDRYLWLTGCLAADVIELYTDDEQREAGRRWLIRLVELGYQADPAEWELVGVSDGGEVP